MAAGRVCLFPCGGIKKTEATIVRQAIYRVNEDLLPGKTLLLCVPAFVRGVQEDLVMIQKNPTVVVDCHEESCGSHLLSLIGIKPAARIFLPELLSKREIGPGQGRQELDETGRELVEVLAGEIARITGALLLDTEYQHKVQPLKTPFRTRLGDWAASAAPSLDYVRISRGLYRPRAMPPLPME